MVCEALKLKRLKHMTSVTAVDCIKKVCKKPQIENIVDVLVIYTRAFLRIIKALWNWEQADYFSRYFTLFGSVKYDSQISKVDQSILRTQKSHDDTASSLTHHEKVSIFHCITTISIIRIIFSRIRKYNLKIFPVLNPNKRIS